MNPLKQRQVLDQIVGHLTYDRRKKVNLLSFYWKGTTEVRRLARKISRQLKTEEREIKRMAWKKQKNRWSHGIYVIHKLHPLPSAKKQDIVYWLGMKVRPDTYTIGLGKFPDIDTAKYIVYLLTKKY